MNSVFVGCEELSRSRRVLSTEAKGQGTANILQIPVADVALRVVFLLFLLCFSPLVRLVPDVVLTLETSEVSAILVNLQRKQLNLVPRSSRLTVH